MTMNLTIASIKIIVPSALALGLFMSINIVQAQDGQVDSIVRLKSPTSSVTTSVKSLITQVIKNPSQKVKAELRGEIANDILKKSSGKAPVYVEVSAIQKLTEQGCYRIGVSFTLPNTLLKRKDGGPSEPLAFWQQMNLCENGLAPSTKEGAAPLPNQGGANP